MNKHQLDFFVGQRYTSHTEPNLGLGIVTELDGRQVIISFPAAGETRAYAMRNAPLSRIQYQVKDWIKSNDGIEICVKSIKEENNISHYTGTTSSGEQKSIAEWELDPFVEFISPETRLFNGQLDHPADNRLRIETLCKANELQGKEIRGLLGSRTQLLPHQIYIAHEVSKRQAPRVLLADEVGLGKTIEAGMILHHQIFSGATKRALVIVPNALIHQWLVEMLRRFNLKFSIFDQSRFDALKSEGYENPFEAEQQVLCTLDTLLDQPEIAKQACEVNWDLMIVDEAHHLTWSPEAPSKAYDLIKHLTTQSTGVLLLTATPEQGGIEGHFARLHLLDPARFHSLDAFQAEDNQYSQIRSIVKTLLETPKNETVQLNKEDIALLIETIGDTVTGTFETYDQRLIAIESILDIHGPGREVFRNTRKSTAGFPRRLTHTYPLALPSEYQNLNGTASLTPEYHCNKQEWPHFDTRIEWLVGWLKQNKQTKCLLICHENNTAIEIDKYLNLRAGIRSTAFYEGLSIIERDRAAAYFSDEECGAQILVCSEIGSEGRNFQFLQDLILFDLPMNPDLLEQRIGRLDRIGQKDTINIHVPYFEHSAQSILLDWYHKGLQQFDHSFSAGYIVFQSFSSRLEDAFDRPEDKALIDNLIKDTMAAKQELSQHRESGRDALLELNSCRTHIATSLIEQIRTEESDQNIQDYLCLAFDRYGVNYETHSDDTLILSAGDDLRIDHFPGLDPDGMTVTFNRERALTREDFQFLTWEHPLVSGVMEMVLTSEFGNACVATLPIKKLPAGSLFLEVWYSVTCSAPKALQIDQYLPITPTRFLIDATGKDLTKALAYDKLNAICQPIKKDIARTIIQRARSTIEFMLQVAHEMMESRLPDYKASASKKAESYLNKELYRLQSLSKVNKSIRPENIEYIERKKTTCLNAIEHAQLNLQGLKLMMTTD